MLKWVLTDKLSPAEKLGPDEKLQKLLRLIIKQARKSSEDAQAARYAQFEKVWTQNTCILAIIHFGKYTLEK